MNTPKPTKPIPAERPAEAGVLPAPFTSSTPVRGEVPVIPITPITPKPDWGELIAELYVLDSKSRLDHDSRNLTLTVARALFLLRIRQVSSTWAIATEAVRAADIEKQVGFPVGAALELLEEVGYAHRIPIPRTGGRGSGWMTGWALDLTPTPPRPPDA